ncbi:MAG: LCP family protein, partial [Candidatus Nanopelagicales bacterium]|nr:LCP family protein [Candidatus Nanopelagicales bacterium]
MSRRVVVGLGLLSLVMVAVLLAVVARTHPASVNPNPTATSKPPLDQQAMLIGVRGRDGQVADVAVIRARVVGSEVSGSLLELPPGLGLAFADAAPGVSVPEVSAPGGTVPEVSAPGEAAQPDPLKATITLADSGGDAPQAVQSRVAAQLGIEIPNGLILDRLAFAALVDAAGGVTVDVPRPIYGKGPTGKRALLFPAGVQQLQGPAAADYAAFLGPGENQSERMVRFSQVWSQVVAGLPSDDSRMRNVIGSLGSLARNSTTVGVMSEILLRYQRAQREQTLLTGSLPARAVGTGKLAVFTPDPVATVAISQRLFPGLQAIPGVDGVAPRVRLVGAGADSDQLVELSRRLSDAKVEVVYGGFAAAQPKTIVFGPRKGTGLVVARDLTSDLGLPEVEVKVDQTKAAGVTA